MLKRLNILILIQIFVILNVFSSSYFIDITREHLLQSKTHSHITFSDWNEFLPTPRTDRIFDQADDLIYRFDIMDKYLFYIKYNNQKVIRFDFRDNSEKEIFSETNKIITDIVIHKDKVYISVIPDGEIYVLDDEEFVLFYESGCKYIWDLESTPHGLALITGNPASLAIIDDTGKNLQNHSLADMNGSIVRYNPASKLLYAGTSNNGLLYRLDPVKKELLSLYQKPKGRIISITFDGKSIYFAEVSAYEPPSRQPRPVHTVTVSGQDPVDPSGYSDASSEGSAQFQQFVQPERILSSIYEFDEKERSSKTIYSQANIVYDFEIIGDYLYILSDEPNLIRIDKNNFHNRRYSSFDVDSMLFINKKYNKYYISTGYPGYIYRFYPGEYEEGEWISTVYTMDEFIEFGDIWFDAGKNSFISFRAGNSLIPDNTWTDWHKMEKPENLGFLPKSLFFQLKFSVDGKKGGYIKGVKLFIRNVSMPCRIKDLSVAKERLSLGVAAVRPRPQAFTPKDPVRFERVQPFDNQKPIIVSWNYDNIEMCNDMTEIRVSVNDYPTGKTIMSTSVYNTNRFEINRSFFPDGKYYIIINPSSVFDKEAGDIFYHSEYFIIDNTPPGIIILEERKNELVIQVTDHTSIIALAYLEYPDGERVYLLPEDAIYDNRKEVFKVDKYLLKRLCIFTAYDLEGNKSSLLLNNIEEDRR